MTFKHIPAIAAVTLGLAAGIAFSVEPGKRTNAKSIRGSDPQSEFKQGDSPQEESKEPSRSNETVGKKSSRTKQRNPSPQKKSGDRAATPTGSRHVSTPKSKQNPFDQAADQDAFLNDLLSDDPAESPKKTPVKNVSRGVLKSRLPENDDSDAIPRLKDEEDLPEFGSEGKSAKSENPSLTEASSFDDLPPGDRQSEEQKPVGKKPGETKRTGRETAQRTKAETPTAVAKTAYLIPLVNLAPEESLVPQVSLNWKIDGPMTLGQETHCRLIVRNPGTAIAQQVSVEARLGDRVKLLSSQPQGIVRDNQLSWDLGNLQPDSEVVLETVFIPEQPGELPISAIVKLGSGSVTRFLVEEPQLAVRMAGEPSVISGEVWNAEVTLLNPGTGTVRATRIESNLPEGVLYEGESQFSLDVGEIPPGESRRVTLPLVCSGKGPLQLAIKASGTAVAARESELSWQVLAPDLVLKTEGPSRRFVSRPAQYSFTIANNGTTPAENVKVACVVPAGFELKEVGQNGQYDQQSNTISWVLDRIGEGETQQLFVDTVAQATGDQIFLIRARSDHGGEASATCETRVDGITSVVMTVNDLNDPIEVGVETGYVLNLRNDGTQRLTDLEILCELPPEVEFLSGTGPTEVEGGKGVIRIGRIAELPPGEELSYQLKVRGHKEGSFRLQAKLSSPELSKPVLAEELTRIYED